MIDYNPRRWTERLLAVRGSVTPRIIWRVLWVAAWSTVVVVVHTFVNPVSVPATAHTLVGLAVGLLLVFRTNGSYERFWEGRKLWGSIVNDSRNLGTDHRRVPRPVVAAAGTDRLVDGQLLVRLHAFASRRFEHRTIGSVASRS